MSKAVDQITREDAKILTDQIRVAVDQLWELLLEAHERKAWKALGYKTWGEYVGAEFSMGRQRSYQILDQGRVIQAIRDVTADLSTIGGQNEKGRGATRTLSSPSTQPDISERDARDIKPILDEVKAEIRSRVEGGDSPAKATAEVVADKRAAKAVRQAAFDRQREENRESLPDSVKEREARKAEAKAASKAKTATSIEALEAEIDELREANASLEAEVASLKSDNAKWQDMKVQFEQGGFEKVIAGKDEEIRVLQSRLETESADKASWMKSAKFWKAEAIKLGYGEDDVIPLAPQGGSNG